FLLARDNAFGDHTVNAHSGEHSSANGEPKQDDHVESMPCSIGLDHFADRCVAGNCLSWIDLRQCLTNCKSELACTPVAANHDVVSGRRRLQIVLKDRGVALSYIPIASLTAYADDLQPIAVTAEADAVTDGGLPRCPDALGQTPADDGDWLAIFGIV